MSRDSSESVAEQFPRSGRASGHAFIRFVVVFLLLGASVMKAHALFIGGPAPLQSNLFNLAINELELVLCIWLASGLQLRSAWVAAIAVFLAFAGINFSLGVQGKTSCGCVGSLALNPWIVFSADLLVLVGLLHWSPHSLFHISNFALFLAWRELILMPILALVLFGGLAWVPSIRASLFPEGVLLHPQVSNLGSFSTGVEVVTRVTITNNSEVRVRLLGGTYDCSVNALRDMPLTLGPGESKAVAMVARFPGPSGTFGSTYTIYTDHPSHAQLQGWVVGDVLPR